MTFVAQQLLNIVNLKLFLDVAAILVGCYMLPTVIAAGRRHPNLTPIAITNATLGWTGIGFLATLIWSFTCSSSHEGAG